MLLLIVLLIMVAGPLLFQFLQHPRGDLFSLTVLFTIVSVPL